MTRPELRTAEIEKAYEVVRVEVRRVLAESNFYTDEIQRITAGAKSVIDEWQRQTRTMSATIEQVREVAEQMRRVDPAVYSAWIDESVAKIGIRRDTARRRANSALDEFRGKGLIDSGAYERAAKLVDVLFTPNTIYSTVAPDDGGVTFYWKAADMSIEIDVYSGEGYWWKVRNVAAENYSSHGVELDFEALKYSLTWFSKEVDRANPHWRQQAT